MTGEPTQEELLVLHRALLAGDDPTTPARLAELLLPPLRQRFRGTWTPDPQSVDSMIGLGIARYLSRPQAYDPERGPLLAYLWRDIDGDLRNERSRPWHRRERPAGEFIEVREPQRNLDVEGEVLDMIDPFDVPPALVEAARQEMSRFEGTDRQLIDLLTAGVRDTAPYAAVLGLSHLPVEQQRREVKRHKDRLRARLEVVRARVRRSD
jgi:hypothetical protein